MEPLDFFSAFSQLRHHAIEVAAKVADFVVALCETYGCLEVTLTNSRDLLLELDHGTLNEKRQHQQQSRADGDCPGSSQVEDRVALGVAPGNRGQHKQEEAVQQNEADRQHRFDLPIDSHEPYAGLFLAGLKWLHKYPSALLCESSVLADN